VTQLLTNYPRKHAEKSFMCSVFFTRKRFPPLLLMLLACNRWVRVYPETARLSSWLSSTGSRLWVQFVQIPLEYCLSI
jgi:hypothetical protein